MHIFFICPLISYCRFIYDVVFLCVLGCFVEFLGKSMDRTIQWCFRRRPRSKMKKTHRLVVTVLASSAVDRGFESRSGQTKDYKIGICWFSAKHAAFRRKSKDWLVRNFRIMCPSGATCLSADCCFIELALLKSN